MKKHPFASFVILAFALSWYPWLLHITRLVPRASGMNPLGVAVAAFITAGLLRGGAGAKELLARLVRFRVHPGWYIFALGLPVAVAMTALGISVLFGAKLEAPFRPHPLALVQSFLFMFFFVGIGEETGGGASQSRNFSSSIPGGVSRSRWVLSGRSGMPRSSEPRLPGFSCRHLYPQFWQRAFSPRFFSFAPALLFR